MLGKNMRTLGERISIVLCVAIWCLIPGAAKAQSSQSVYQLNWAVDGAITGVGLAAWVLPQLFVDKLASSHCPCASEDVNGLDRSTAGAWRPGVALTSDVLVGTTYGLAFALDAIDVVAKPGGGVAWLEDAMVIAESAVIAGALTSTTKVIVQRPRPLVYGRSTGDPLLDNGDNFTSFFSGHTAGAFAIGLSMAQTYALRHPNSALRFVMYGAAILLGSGIATLRVASGKHFPSDVLVGAAVGSAVGLTIPWLHQRAPAAQLAWSAQPGGMVLSIAVFGQ